MATHRLWQALRRLGSSNEDLQAEDRQRLADAVGAGHVGDAADRERVRLRGFITVLTTGPRGSTPWLEAELSDGSGTISLIWMGRREIPGVSAGRELLVEGRVSYVDGARRIYNPHYELIAGA